MAEGFFHYKNITATGVSTISISQAGLLHGVIINNVSTAAATMAIYDATTTAAAPFIIGTVNIASAAMDYLYDAEFKNGLTVEVATAATPTNITILYR